MKAIVLVIAMMVAIGATLSIAKADEATTTKATYMGVNADDLEAVRRVQRELGHEQWQKMFGDSDINHLDFSPDFSNHDVPKVLLEKVDKVKEAFRTLLSMLRGQRMPGDRPKSSQDQPDSQL